MAGPLNSADMEDIRANFLGELIESGSPRLRRLQEDLERAHRLPAVTGRALPRRRRRAQRLRRGTSRRPARLPRGVPAERLRELAESVRARVLGHGGVAERVR